MRFFQKFFCVIFLFQIFISSFAQLAPSGISVNFYVRTFPASNNNNVTLVADNPYILEPLIGGFVCSNLSIKWVIAGTGKHTISNVNANSPTITLTPGIYSVELYAGTTPSNAFEFCGASSNSRKKTNWITVPYTTPAAKFKTNGTEVATTTVALNSTVKFTDASTGYPTSWLWSVSPNTGWSFTAGNSGSQNPDITFTSSGDYTVSLKATNPAGNQTATKLNHVKVLAGPPTADFNANGSGQSPLYTLQNTAVSFNDLSSNKPTAWEWTISPATGFTFSSGNKNSQNPQVTFSTLGNYSVSLKVTNTGGTNTITKTNYIVVTPPPPVVVSPKNYCRNETATNLTATGSNLKWYTDPTSNVSSSAGPKPSTSNIGTFSYYVSQTVGGIESGRAKFDVVVNDIPGTPTVNSSVNYCVGSPASALTANVTVFGNTLKWYTTASGGTGSANAPIPSTTTIGTTNYYVAQINTNSCEGPRSMISVKVSGSLEAPIATSPVNFCLGYPSTALTASGTGLKWYTVSSGGTALSAAPVPATSTAGSKKYYVAQTVQGCPESPRTEVNVNTNNGTPPALPTVNSPVTFMQGTQSTALTATGTNLTWYETPTGGIGSLVAPVPVTTSASEKSWYVSQTNAYCEGMRATLNVVVTPTPGGTADWVWAGNLPGFASNDRLASDQIVVDSVGNTYVASNFSGSITLGNTTLTSSGGTEIFIAKYNPAGSLIWAKKVTSGTGSEIVNGFTMDKVGNLYICGNFSGKAIFGNIAYDNSATSSARDAYVAKYDSTGAVKWARREPNTYGEWVSANSIAVNKDGIVIVVGNEPYKFGSSSLPAAFTLTFDSLGLNRVHRSPSGGQYGVGVDNLGNYYVGGTVNTTPQNTSNRFFIAKFSTSHEQIWQRSMGPNAVINSIVTDKNGNSFITGSFSGTITLENTILTGTGKNMFIIKFDAAGNIMWAKKVSGAAGNAITIDRFGNSFVAGNFTNTATFDNIILKSNRIDGSDIFAAKYNPAGEVIWAQLAGGNNNANGRGIGVDRAGNTYVSGAYFQTGIFGTETISGERQFIAKLGSAIPVLPELFTDRLAEETYIAGDKLDIAFSITGSYGNENYFTAQLSNAAGFFNNPVNIGIGKTTPIKAMIPLDVLPGNNYRVRVVANQPEIIGTDNGTNIVINKGSTSPPPNWVWGKNIPEVISTLLFDRPYQVTDALGNTYVTGNFFGTISIGTVTLTSLSYDIFVAKYDKDGAVLWLRKAAGGAGEEMVKGIALDVEGNYYLTGGYKGTASLGGLSLTNTTQFFDLFVAKYTSSGTAVWAKKTGSQYDNQGLAITVNPAGTGVYLVGHADTRINITTYSYEVWQELIIQKYDGNGLLLWERHPTGSTSVNELASSIVLDAAENIYIAGYKRLKNASGQALLYKFNSSGGKIFEKISSSNSEATGIALDISGNIYMTGTCSGILTMGGKTSGVSYAITDYFLTKLKPDGETQWIKQGGGRDYDQGFGITVDRSGHIYTTGRFQHTAVFGQITLTQSNSGAGDVFVAKYDSLGNTIWVQKAGLGGWDAGYNIGQDDEGNSYISGIYRNAIVFGDSTLSGKRLFVAKLGAAAAPSKITFTPPSGSVGDTVTIKGFGFSDVSDVQFNEQPAAYFRVDSSSLLKAVVATGTNTGPISVTTQTGGKGTSNEPFTIIDKVTGSVMLCPPSGSTQLMSNLSGATYQWQVNTGSGFTNIADDIHYKGTNTRTLSLTEIPASWSGYQYRCRVNSSNSKTFKLDFIVAWTGQQNSIWENANNWSCGIIPDENTRVHFSSNAVVLISSNVTVKSMTAMPGSIITVKPGYKIVLAGN